MGNKYTSAQKAATIKYLTEKTEEVRVRVPKGKKSVYQELAKSKGKSLSKLVQELLDEELKNIGSL
ncbi:MAG: hypothetical protein K2N38_06220 [Oscillospiraceae bacterium]|nr:hypothetical protein [Oscillospiraceae bacterium]